MACECDQSPVFIVGCPRSGTTLLRLMLTAHSQLGIPPEGPFIRDLYPAFGHWPQFDEARLDAFLARFYALPKCREWGLEPHALRAYLRARRPASYAALVDAVYRAYLAQKEPGKQRWGDKNPRYVLHVPLLHALFPRAKFIHLIRDGRDVAVSHRQPPFNVHAVARAARLWKACVLQGHRHGLALGEAHYLEVRYEALCLSPRPVLARLCDFLGIPLEYERMLRFYADNAARQLIPPARHAWHRNTFVPLTAARIGVWRRELAPADVEAFEALAGDVLEKFGYAVGSGSG